MLVTHSLLERVKTLRGGLTIVQSEILGYKKGKKGWKRRIIGKDVKEWRVLFEERNRTYEKAGIKDKSPTLKANLKRKSWSTKGSVGLDVTYSDTWKTRSNNLSMPYSEFLKSDHWLAVKKKAALRKDKYGSCEVCGTTKNIELHHTSYKWIGTKNELCNVIPLCRTHHQKVHDVAKETGTSVRRATIAVRKRYRNEEE